MTKVKQEKSFVVHWISGKTFAELILSVLKVLKKAIAQKIHSKIFAFHRKSAKTIKLFSCLTFVAYGNNKQSNGLYRYSTKRS